MEFGAVFVSGAEGLVGWLIGEVLVLGHCLVGSLPLCTLRPALRCGSSRRARRQPLLASAMVKGRVALLSAKVEVRATAPGMLATQ